MNRAPPQSYDPDAKATTLLLIIMENQTDTDILSDPMRHPWSASLIGNELFRSWASQCIATAMTSGQCNGPITLPCRSATFSLMLHHAHPKHRLVADIDIVFANEIELAVVVYSEHREAGWYDTDRSPLFDRQRHDMGGDQYAPAGVDVKCSAVDAARIDMLDEGRLAGGGIDLVDGDRILCTREYGLALDLHRRGGAIDGVHKAAVRVYVDGARDLPAADVVGLG